MVAALALVSEVRAYRESSEVRAAVSFSRNILHCSVSYCWSWVSSWVVCSPLSQDQFTRGMLCLLCMPPDAEICKCRGIYEVTETYGEERGEPNTSPWVWNSAGQHMAWMGIQAAGAHPLGLQHYICTCPSKVQSFLPVSTRKFPHVGFGPCQASCIGHASVWCRTPVQCACPVLSKALPLACTHGGKQRGAIVSIIGTICAA